MVRTHCRGMEGHKKRGGSANTRCDGRGGMILVVMKASLQRSQSCNGWLIVRSELWPGRQKSRPETEFCQAVTILAYCTCRIKLARVGSELNPEMSIVTCQKKHIQHHRIGSEWPSTGKRREAVPYRDNLSPGLAVSHSLARASSSQSSKPRARCST